MLRLSISSTRWGDPLATLIAEASSTEHPDTRQRLVVRGRPVHKANTMMQEEADLREYEAYLCSGFVWLTC